MKERLTRKAVEDAAEVWLGIDNAAHHPRSSRREAAGCLALFKRRETVASIGRMGFPFCDKCFARQIETVTDTGLVLSEESLAENVLAIPPIKDPEAAKMLGKLADEGMEGLDKELGMSSEIMVKGQIEEVPEPDGICRGGFKITDRNELTNEQKKMLKDAVLPKELLTDREKGE